MLRPKPTEHHTVSIAATTPTVASGFWNNTAPPNQYHRTNTERTLGRVLAKRGNTGLRKVWRALTGVAPGASVTDTYARVLGPTAFTPYALGGLRTIETVTTPYNRVTAAADVTYIDTNIIDPVAAVQTYPTDLSGNGGGGKVQR